MFKTIEILFFNIYLRNMLGANLIIIGLILFLITYFIYLILNNRFKKLCKIKHKLNNIKSIILRHLIISIIVIIYICIIIFTYFKSFFASYEYIADWLQAFALIGVVIHYQQYYKNHKISWDVVPNEQCRGSILSKYDKSIGYIINKVGEDTSVTIHIHSLSIGKITPKSQVTYTDMGVSFEGSTFLDKQYQLNGNGPNKQIFTEGKLHEIFSHENPGKYHCVLTFCDYRKHNDTQCLVFDYNYHIYENESYIIRFY